MVLMFDVNQPQTLEALRKWWDEFKDKTPIPDEEVGRFCCVFVGNKIDVSPPNGDTPSGPTPLGNSSRVHEDEAIQFMHELVPPPPFSASPLGDTPPSQGPLPSEESTVTLSILTPSPPRTHSIDIGVYHHPRRKSARSRSRSTLFRGSTVGTMTTAHTLSVYHTPTSSFFDTFESARSSPVRCSRRASPARSRSPSQSPVRAARRQPSFSSASTASDAQTITPSLFGRAHGDTRATTPSTTPHALPVPPPLEMGARLFFTSAKTGEGVSDVFEYVAQRVVRRWEYEEAVEARTLHMADASADGTIRLQHSNDSSIWKATSCCRS